MFWGIQMASKIKFFMHVLQFHDAFMKHLSIDKGISRKNGGAQKQEWAFKNDFKSLPIQYSQN